MSCYFGSLIKVTIFAFVTNATFAKNLQSACVESRDDLRHSYAQIIEVS